MFNEIFELTDSQWQHVNIAWILFTSMMSIINYTIVILYSEAQALILTYAITAILTLLFLLVKCFLLFDFIKK